MKKFFISLLCLSIFAGSLFFAKASEFEGVGGVPAHPDPSVQYSKEWFIYTLSPGEKKDDELLVINNSDRETSVILYPADSTPSTDGGFALKQLVEPRELVGKWITLSKTELTLPPHGSEIVPFKIEVPKDSSLDVGEHAGGILIQKKNQQTENSNGLQLLTRVGVRVYVTIPGTIVKKLEIQKFQVDFDPLKKMYTAVLTIKNSGNVSQDVTFKTRVTLLDEWVKKIPFLKDFFGQFPVENERDLQVLRDDTLTSNFEFKKPPFGKLKVEALIEYDGKTQTLNTNPIIIEVPIDRDILVWFVLCIAFITLLFAFIILKKKKGKDSRKTKNTKKTKKNAKKT